MPLKYIHALPDWLHLDNRPMDRGEWQPFGYGYSRPVTNREVWRPVIKYIMRRRKDHSFKEYTLLPGAYYVSDHARVYSALANRIISKKRTHSRKDIHLVTDDGSVIKVRKYRLALDNFIQPPKNVANAIYKLMDSCNHKDGKPWRDRLDNVQYSPLQINREHQHKILHKGGRRKKEVS